MLRARGTHFFTGIRPSWFTCSFSFVYLGRQRPHGHTPAVVTRVPATARPDPRLTLFAGTCFGRRSEPGCS